MNRHIIKYRQSPGNLAFLRAAKDHEGEQHDPQVA
jgi:hypothetical protein